MEEGIGGEETETMGATGATGAIGTTALTGALRLERDNGRGLLWSLTAIDYHRQYALRGREREVRLTVETTGVAAQVALGVLPPHGCTRRLAVVTRGRYERCCCLGCCTS
jgi:hypothetical protein